MKKLISLLGVVTITSTGLTTLTSNNFLSTNTTVINNLKKSQSQITNTTSSSESKSDWLDDWFKELRDLKLTPQQQLELNMAYDPAMASTADFVSIFSAPTISETINYKGGKFTFEWKWFHAFYWTLKMDHAGCEVYKNYAASLTGGFTAVAGSTFVAALLAAGGATTATGGFAAAFAAAAASPALNFYLTGTLIEQNDKGNGIWIGFWINQPGIGWGSL